MEKPLAVHISNHTLENFTLMAWTGFNWLRMMKWMSLTSTESSNEPSSATEDGEFLDFVNK